MKNVITASPTTNAIPVAARVSPAEKIDGLPMLLNIS